MEYTYKDIIKEIRKDNLYDFITRKTFSLDKTDLRDLILELYYMLRVERTIEDEEEVQKLLNDIVEHLKDNRDWDE